MTQSRRIVALDRFGAPEVMRWADAPIPERGADEVTVDVTALGINFADTMVRRGEYRRDQPLDFTPGVEVAGVVREGPADGPPPGTAVVVFCEHGGGYADTVVAPLDHVVTIPHGIDAVQAAGLFVQGVTAWYAVHRYGMLAPGETALVHAAAGGLGTLCLGLVADAGGRPIAAASTAAKLAVAREHGAADGVLSDPETLTQEVRRLTGGHGADVVIDGVAGPVFAPSMRALAFGGRYVVAGAASQQAAPLDARALMPRGQTVTGFVVRRVMDSDPAEPQHAFDEICARLRSGALAPAIAVRGPDELPEIHREIEARTFTGKIVVKL